MTIILYNMDEKWLLFAICCASLLVPALTAADQVECSMPKSIECFYCDSRVDAFCHDKFNRTDPQSLKSIKKCDGECLKWVRQFEPSDPNSKEYVIRSCKENVTIQMYLSPDMCIGESRPGSGHMCTCQVDRCNHAPQFKQQWVTLLLYSITVLCWLLKM